MVKLGCKAKVAADAAHVKMDYTTLTALFSYYRAADEEDKSIE